MNDSILKNIPITALIIIYLFFCGTLYLMGYWSTFDVDIFSIISIYDIPKNFVFPLLLSQGFLTLYLTFSDFISFEDDRINKKHFITIDTKWSLPKKIVLGFFTLIDLWVITIIFGMIMLDSNFKNNYTFWLVSSLIIAYSLLHKFVNLQFVKNIIENLFLKYFIAHFIIFVPISCFTIGKITSLKIYHNESYKATNIIATKIISIKSDTTRLKLLGFISDKLIYSTIDNKKTYILNKEAYDGIIIIK